MSMVSKRRVESEEHGSKRRRVRNTKSMDDQGSGRGLGRWQAYICGIRGAKKILHIMGLVTLTCTASTPAAAIAVTADETHTLSASIATAVAFRYSRRRNRCVSAVVVAAFACRRMLRLCQLGSVPGQRPAAKACGSVHVVSRKVKTNVLRLTYVAAGKSAASDALPSAIRSN